MITKEELLEGIAECQGQRNPNANTCYKLASFYTILDHMEDKENPGENIVKQTYSYASKYQSDTEFGEIIKDLDTNEVLDVMDELMSTLSIVQPRLYASVIRKLKGQ